MKYLFLVISLFTLTTAASAQSPAGTKGDIILHQPEVVEILISRHKQFLDEVNVVPGYRIQVLSTTKLSAAENTKARFVTSFDDIPAHIDFTAPYYKLKVGDFRNRGHAFLALQRVREVYPDSFIVKDQVKVLER